MFIARLMAALIVFVGIGFEPAIARMAPPTRGARMAPPTRGGEDDGGRGRGNDNIVDARGGEFADHGEDGAEEEDVSSGGSDGGEERGELAGGGEEEVPSRGSRGGLGEEEGDLVEEGLPSRGSRGGLGEEEGDLVEEGLPSRGSRGERMSVASEPSKSEVFAEKVADARRALIENVLGEIVMTCINTLKKPSSQDVELELTVRPDDILDAKINLLQLVVNIAQAVPADANQKLKSLVTSELTKLVSHGESFVYASNTTPFTRIAEALSSVLAKLKNGELQAKIDAEAQLETTAATKIQSLVRGRQGREAAKIKRNEKDLAKKVAEEAAATKIQSIARGSMARKSVSTIKAEIQAFVANITAATEAVKRSGLMPADKTRTLDWLASLKAPDASDLIDSSEAPAADSRRDQGSARR